MNAENPSGAAGNTPLLRASPEFKRLWVTQTTGTVAYRMFHMALLWAAIETGAAWEAATPGQHLLGAGLRIACLLLASALPPVLFSKRVGRSVEVRPIDASLRSALAGITAFAAFSALLLGVPALSGALTAGAGHGALFLVLVGISFLSATFQAPFDPAVGKGIGRTVPPARVGEAVAWQTSTQSLANFGGAVAGAGLIAALTVPGVMALAALLAGVGVVLNRRGAPSTSPQDPHPTPAEPPTASPLPQPSLAKPYAREHRLLMCFGCVNFFATPLLVLIPLLVKGVYGGRASLLGWLEGALWVGLLAGSLLAGRLAGRIPPLRVPFPAVLAMGLALAAGVFGGESLHVSAHALGLFAFGVALGLNNTSMLGHFQAVVADADKGRFFANMQAVVSATFPLGYLVFGAAADALGAREASYVQSVGLGASALLFLFQTRSAPAAHEPPATAVEHSIKEADTP